MSKFCPICDQKVNGNFCWTCRRIITPYEHSGSYHLNERHTMDADCDYHGTSWQEEQLYHGTDIDPCGDGDHRYDYVNRLMGRDTAVSHKKNSSDTIGLVFFVMIMVAVAVFTIISSIVEDQREFEEVDNRFDMENVVTMVDDSDEKPFDIYGSEVAEELMEKYKNEGFSEDGIKSYDRDAVMAMGQETNGYILFEDRKVTTMRHMKDVLEKKKVAYKEYGTDEGYYYDYMDKYGDIYRYYVDWDYLQLGQDEESKNYLSVGYDVVTKKTAAVELCMDGNTIGDFNDIAVAILEEMFESTEEAWTEKEDIYPTIIADFMEELQEGEITYHTVGNLFLTLTFIDQAEGRYSLEITGYLP